MSNPSTCSRCGAALAAATDGVCPRCELAAALEPPPPFASPPGAAPESALKHFGDYELLEELGHGGMGVVYKARHTRLNRVVALKLLLLGQFSSAAAIRRFQREAQAAAALRHPNIVALHDIGELAGQPYFTMEFVEGRSLAALLREGPLPARRAAEYGRAIADAMSAAHTAGIIHRDLKPSNIVLDPFDQPRVTDFGLAKRFEPVGADVRRLTSPSDGSKRGKGEKEQWGTDEVASAPCHPRPSDGRGAGGEGEPPLASESDQCLLTSAPTIDLTLTGQILGSPNYLAPELAAGRMHELSPASDLFSIGAMLYECLTGRPPFVAATLQETLFLLRDAEPVPPRVLNPRLPRDLETICLKCLEKEPAQRYATARELADELGRFLKDEPIHARPVGRVEKAWRWCRRKPALAGSLLLILLLLLLITIGSPLAAYRINRERQRAEEQATRAELQSQRAEQNAANERRERYYASIAAADSHIRNGDIDVALKVLTNCPSEFRHWEWGRLLYLCHQDVATVRLNTNNAESLIVNVDGTRAASAQFLLGVGGGGSVCWEVGTGRELFRFGSATGKVTEMKFSPDGRQVAMARLNGQVKIWDALTGEERVQFNVSNEVFSLQFNRDGTQLVLTTADSRCSIWDTAKGELVTTTPTLSAAPKSSAMDPTGRYWATLDEADTLVLRDARTGTPRFTMQGYRDTNPTTASKEPTLRFSSDGRHFLAHASAQAAKVWNTETGRELLIIPSRVYAAAFSPDGRQVAIIAGNKTAEVWDLTTGEKSRTIRGHAAPLNFIGFDRDGRRLFTADARGVLKTWSADFGREVLRHTYPADHVAFSPEGKRVLTTQFDGLAKIWDTESGRELLAFRGNWNWLRVANFSPDGKRIVTGGADRMARIFAADSGQELMVLKGHVSGVRTAVFSPDGRKVATGSWDRTARIWDAQTGEELFTLSAHTEAVRFVAFTPDGRHLVTLGNDTAARVWEAETGQHLFALDASPSRMGALAISPDGTRIATGSGSIRLWDAKTGELLGPWRTRSRIMDLAFSPDGRRLVVVTSENWGVFAYPAIEVWDVETGRQVLVMQDHSTLVMSAKFSPDGRRLATACIDGLVRVRETFPWEERLHPEAPAVGNASPLLRPTAERARERRQFATTNSPLLNPLPTGSSQGEEAAARPLTPSLSSTGGEGARSAGEGVSSTPLARIQAYAVGYWRERLAAEGASDAPTSLVATNEFPRFPRSAWPPRDPGLSPNQIDLSAHYNGLLDVPWQIVLQESDYDNDLSGLPTGAVMFSNVTFDVRGLIRLRAANWVPVDIETNSFPVAVTGIRIGVKCSRIHLLHGADGAVAENTVIGNYVLRYVDGTHREIPIRYGRDVRHWWQVDDDTRETDQGVVVWRGSNPAVKGRGGRLRIYLSTLENPEPEKEIQSLDIVSALTRSGPFLIALTIEP